MQCPKCAGKSGFILTKITRNSEFVRWDGVVSHVEGEHLRENKRVKCWDCGTLLKISPEIELLIINRDN